MRRLEVRAYLSGDFETWAAFVELRGARLLNAHWRLRGYLTKRLDTCC